MREATPKEEAGRATTTQLKGVRKNGRDISRGTMPLNKQPLWCRVLENEIP